jgi:hypothetical protein
MAGEIVYQHDAAGASLYATAMLLSDEDGQTMMAEPLTPGMFWDISIGDLTSFLGFGSILGHALPMSNIDTPGGYVHAADMPAAPAGKYRVRVYEQAGASPDPLTDTKLDGRVIEWDGGKEIALKDVDADLATIDSVVDAIKVVTDALADVDSTGTETVPAAKALEIILAALAGVAGYDTSTNVWTLKGRDGATTLATVGVASPAGSRNSSSIA